jgi:hypothetical protein
MLHFHDWISGCLHIARGFASLCRMACRDDPRCFGTGKQPLFSILLGHIFSARPGMKEL